MSLHNRMFTKKITIDYFADKRSKLQHPTGGLAVFVPGYTCEVVSRGSKEIFFNVSSTGDIF